VVGFGVMGDRLSEQVGKSVSWLVASRES